MESTKIQDIKDPTTIEASKKPNADEEIVVVVVGAKEFHEESAMLCSKFSYFKAALSSGMKESHTKRFEFPHRNPDEWILKPMEHILTE